MKKISTYIILCAVAALFFSCRASIPRAMGAYSAAKDAPIVIPTEQKPQPKYQAKPQAITITEENAHSDRRDPVIKDTVPPEPAKTPPPEPKQQEMREETFMMVSLDDMSKLKTYSVVVGTFQNKENAQRLKEYLKKEGYSPIVVINTNEMYRVLLASYDTYETAKAMAVEVQDKYEGAWVLVQKR